MAFHSFAFSGADRSEGLSAYFVAKLGEHRAVCGLSRPRLQAKMYRFAAPSQHNGEMGTHRPYLFPSTGL